MKKISSAVILAAGYSSRLGQPKALVKWNEETLIERSIRLLEEAEIKMMELYIKRAKIEDGQTILDLGCGWGSLTLFLAERFPNSVIYSVSNSNDQIKFIHTINIDTPDYWLT